MQGVLMLGQHNWATYSLSFVSDAMGNILQLLDHKGVEVLLYLHSHFC